MISEHMNMLNFTSNREIQIKNPILTSGFPWDNRGSQNLPINLSKSLELQGEQMKSPSEHGYSLDKR